MRERGIMVLHGRFLIGHTPCRVDAVAAVLDVLSPEILPGHTDGLFALVAHPKGVVGVDAVLWDLLRDEVVALPHLVPEHVRDPDPPFDDLFRTLELRQGDRRAEL